MSAPVLRLEGNGWRITRATCAACGGSQDVRDGRVASIATDGTLTWPCGEEPDTALVLPPEAVRLRGLGTKPYGYAPAGRYNWYPTEAGRMLVTAGPRFEPLNERKAENDYEGRA